MSSVLILDTTSGAGTGESHGPGPESRPGRTWHCLLEGTGALTATVLVEVSNDGGSTWITHVTFTMAGTTSAVDGVATEAAWQLFRARTTAISGTDARVRVWMGV